MAKPKVKYMSPEKRQQIKGKLRLLCLLIYRQNGISKAINLTDNTTNQSSKVRPKKLAEVNDDASGTYNTNGRIKL